MAQLHEHFSGWGSTHCRIVGWRGVVRPCPFRTVKGLGGLVGKNHCHSADRSSKHRGRRQVHSVKLPAFLLTSLHVNKEMHNC